MSALHRTATTAALCAGLLLAAGCQSDGDGKAQPLPPIESSTSPSESTSPSPSPSTEPTTPAWQDKYSQKQIAAYEAALDRYATYEQRSEPIWRRGKATPAAEQLFKDYFEEGVWQTQMSRLRLYEEAEVKIAGTPEVLWSRPTRISTGTVLIRQCVDYRPTETTQYGNPTKPVKSRQRPVIRLLGLTKDGSEPWLIYKFVTKPDGKDRPCTARS